MNADLMSTIENVQRASSAKKNLVHIYNVFNFSAVREAIISGLPDYRRNWPPFALFSNPEQKRYVHYSCAAGSRGACAGVMPASPADAEYPTIS